MWTTERILGLAPDESSAKAGQGLASPRKWVTVGQTERILWGECQGSGSKPYQTQIDLSEPAFKCSCPSRKFPCKHALGLFLMLGPKVGTVTGEPPAWVTAWLATRAEKAAKKQEKIEKAAEAPVDPAAAAKRLADRFGKITAGAADLQTWLEDMVRQGLAAAQTADGKFWETPAARMVDAQAPGLARLVREIPENNGPEWHVGALRKAARLHLVLQATQRLDALPDDLRRDVRQAVGVPIKEEELAPLPAVKDRWHVLGQTVEEEERLKTQRTWLIGEATNHAAPVLEFAYGGQPLKSTLVVGTQFDGELVFYPGSQALRAAIRNRAAETTESHGLAGHATVAAALATYADALARTPWLETFPLALANMRLVKDGENLLAVDSERRILPLEASDARQWLMLSLTGGHPAGLFGEWTGTVLLPRSVWLEGVVHGL